MKKMFYLTAIGILLANLSQLFVAQALQNNARLIAEVEKSHYLRLEPILARFDLVIPSNEGSAKVLKNISIKVTRQGVTRAFQGLTSIVSVGEPQPLPGNHVIEAPKPTQVRDVEYTEQFVIDRVGEFFPEAGMYQVQFLATQANGKVIPSNVIDITIDEPMGLDREAFELLNKYEKPMSFDWVWKQEGREDCLQQFVDKYGTTVYGPAATLYLGRIYLAKGEFGKAKNELQKIKESRNGVFAREAAEVLADIQKREADLLKQQ